MTKLAANIDVMESLLADMSQKEWEEYLYNIHIDNIHIRKQSETRRKHHKIRDTGHKEEQGILGAKDQHHDALTKST